MTRWAGSSPLPAPAGCTSRTPRQGRIPEGVSAPAAIRTPNLLIRSQALYPLSYGGLQFDYTGRVGRVNAQPGYTLHGGMELHPQGMCAYPRETRVAATKSCAASETVGPRRTKCCLFVSCGEFAARSIRGDRPLRRGRLTQEGSPAEEH